MNETAGKVAFAIAVLLVVAAWLVLVAIAIGSEPTMTDGGVVVDEYERAKEILVLLLPILTAVVGYWGGADGKGKADEAARTSQARLAAVLDASQPGTMKIAEERHPELFSS